MLPSRRAKLDELNRLSKSLTSFPQCGVLLPPFLRSAMLFRTEDQLISKELHVRGCDLHWETKPFFIPVSCSNVITLFSLMYAKMVGPHIE